jgi:aspartyl-tRNA synthetase
MIITEENSIRDTIAFLKTTSALSLMNDSSSEIADERLIELYIILANEKEI